MGWDNGTVLSAFFTGLSVGLALLLLYAIAVRYCFSPYAVPPAGRGGSAREFRPPYGMSSSSSSSSSATPGFTRGAMVETAPPTFRPSPFDAWSLPHHHVPPSPSLSQHRWRNTPDAHGGSMLSPTRAATGGPPHSPWRGHAACGPTPCSGSSPKVCAAAMLAVEDEDDQATGRSGGGGAAGSGDRAHVRKPSKGAAAACTGTPSANTTSTPTVAQAMMAWRSPGLKEDEDADELDQPPSRRSGRSARAVSRI